MAILELQSSAPEKTLVAWYLKHWRGTDTPPADIVYPFGPWTVVARKASTCFETIQIKSAPKGSLGYIGISLPGQTQPEHRDTVQFPLPPGAQLLLSLASNDAGKHATNYLLYSPDSIQTTVDYYRRRLLQLGWALQMDENAMGLGQALMFQRKAEHAELTISNRGGKTSVFITIVHA